MDAFHDVRFPTRVSFGATGGPERRNEIVLLASGREKRNARFASSRRRYDVGTGIRSLADLSDVVAFFEARRGSLHAFRFRDPFDMKSCRAESTPGPYDQRIATGDGQTSRFILTKTYGEGDDAYVRAISRPVADSIRVAVDGQETSPADFSIDGATGEILFAAGSAPGDGAEISAGFLFDVPVRFDADSLSVNLAAFNAGHIPAIPLVEVLE